jgi:hypothetical protein
MQRHPGKHRYGWASRLFVLVLFATLIPAHAALAAPKACNDGLDNDGDSLIDYPADPGCVSKGDNDEFNQPPPPPGCVGVNVAAGANLRNTFNSFGGGTTYCLAAGTYLVPDTTDAAELRMDAGDVVWGAGVGVTIIDGSLGTNMGRGIVGSTGGADLSYTYRDLTIGHSGRWINPANPCPSSGDCGKAFISGSVTLLNLRCTDNGTTCAGVALRGLTMDNVECDGNGWHPEAVLVGIASCVKTTRGTTIVRNSNIHDNYGNGIWADTCDNDAVPVECVLLVENNQIVHNGHAGVDWEVSGFYRAGDNAIVRYNTIQNNGWNSPPCNECGSGILINDGVNIDVHHNIFGGNQFYTTAGGFQCCRAIRIIDGARQPGNVYNITIHDNTLNGDFIFQCTAVGVTCTNNT